MSREVRCSGVHHLSTHAGNRDMASYQGLSRTQQPRSAPAELDTRVVRTSGGSGYRQLLIESRPQQGPRRCFADGPHAGIPSEPLRWLTIVP